MIHHIKGIVLHNNDLTRNKECQETNLINNKEVMNIVPITTADSTPTETPQE
jgi:hypothetical protein